MGPGSAPVPRPEDFEAVVVIYSTAWCGYCRMAEGLLERTHTSFERVDVSMNPEARAWLAKTTGQRTVPQIFIQGRSIGGFQELYGLVRRGELDDLLG